MRAWVAVLVALALAACAVQVGAQDFEHVRVTLTAEPVGRLLIPVEENGTARVLVEPTCRSPTALYPSWRIEHEVRVRPTWAVATLEPSTQTVTFGPTDCVDGRVLPYEVLVDIRFADHARFNEPVRLVFWANVSLQNNPSYEVEWEERANLAGGVDIESDYPGTVRTDAMNELGFWVSNNVNAEVAVSAEIVTPPQLGEARFQDARSVPVDERRVFRVQYTPQEEGQDRFEVRVRAHVGAVEVGNQTLVYEVVSDPEAEIARVSPNYGDAPFLPGPVWLALLVGMLAAARRRGPSQIG